MAVALASCSAPTSDCAPQAFLDQDQTDQDVIAPELLDAIPDVDPGSTHLLADLSGAELRVYLGATATGDICLVMVTVDASSGCSPNAAGLEIGDATYRVGLVDEDQDDAPPASAVTQSVPDACLAFRS